MLGKKDILLLIVGALIGVFFEQILNGVKDFLSNYPESIEYSGKIVDSNNGYPIAAIKFTVVGDSTIEPATTNIDGIFKVIINTKNHDRYIRYHIEDTRKECAYKTVSDTVELMEVNNPIENKISLAKENI